MTITDAFISFKATTVGLRPKAPGTIFIPTEEFQSHYGWTETELWGNRVPRKIAFQSHYGWTGTIQAASRKKTDLKFQSHYGWTGTPSGFMQLLCNPGVSKPLRLDWDI